MAMRCRSRLAERVERGVWFTTLGTHPECVLHVRPTYVVLCAGVSAFSLL